MKNKRQKIFTAIIMVMVFVASASFVSAKSYDLRNDTSDSVTVELPDDWEMSEVAASQGDGSNEQIMYAYNEKDDSSFMDLSIFFMTRPYDEYIYFYSDQYGATSYYEKYGKGILEEYYSEHTDSELVSLGDAEYYGGEWNGFLKVSAVVNRDIKGEKKQGEELIYLTATDSIANELLVFSGYDTSGTPYTAAQMEDTARPIVESFYDRGYGSQMLGEDSYDSKYADDYADGSDTSQVDFTAILKALGGLLPLIVIAGSFIITIIKAKNKKRSSDDFTVQGFKKKTEKKQSLEKQLFSPRNTARHESRWDKTKPDKARSNEARLDKGHADNSRPETRSNKTWLDKVRLDKAQSGKTDGRTFTGWQPSKRTQGDAGSIGTAGRAGSDAGAKYIECLHTLYKSGLLTKSELGQMIDKYEKRRY